MISENLCGLSPIIQQKLKILFDKYVFIDEVIIFGSRAKGNFKAGSDIDLTIKSEEMSLRDLLKIENEIDDLLLPYKIDISLYRHIENKNLIDHINRVGILFYKKKI